MVRRLAFLIPLLLAILVLGCGGGSGTETGTGRLFRWGDEGLVFVTTALSLLGDVFVVDHAPWL